MDALDKIAQAFDAQETLFSSQLKKEEQNHADLVTFETHMSECGEAFDAEDFKWVKDAKEERMSLVEDLKIKLSSHSKQREKYEHTFAQMKKTLQKRRDFLDDPKRVGQVLEKNPDLTKKLAQKQVSLLALYQRQLDAAAGEVKPDSHTLSK